jgi:hypothetical protein
MATVPDAYDVAVIITGDKDFMPAMQKTRLTGTVCFSFFLILLTRLLKLFLDMCDVIKSHLYVPSVCCGVIHHTPLIICAICMFSFGMLDWMGLNVI